VEWCYTHVRSVLSNSSNLPSFEEFTELLAELDEQVQPHANFAAARANVFQLNELYAVRYGVGVGWGWR